MPDTRERDAGSPTRGSTAGVRRPASDVAFTPAVKAIQEQRGSRAGYRRMEEGGGWQTTVTPDLAAFVAAQTSIFMATANGEGQPYIQHRGGPQGFLKVLDERTLGFADLRGNRQYITLGNLQDNGRAFLFLIDYTHRRRIKIWGTAEVVENDPALVERLLPPADESGRKPAADQAILFRIEAWDANCPQHIPQRFEAADVAAALDQRDRRIAELEAELARLRAA